MRLFVALVPPAGAVAELAVATAALRAAMPGLRWTRTEQWHLTLAFLGEVEDGTRAPLAERLDRVARRHPPMRLSLAGGGRFGSRVLWTRVDGDRPALRRLAASVRAAARRCGLTVDRRPYRPHLTLARGVGADDLAPPAERLRTFAGSVWEADELHLVRSHLGTGPARHETLATWPLAGPGGPDSGSNHSSPG